ncbi:MAG: YcaO-like family protein [Alishewanella aestuarii]
MDNLRQFSAADTLARLAPLTVLAGVSRLANLTHLDKLGLPVWCAIRPLARSFVTSLGKGLLMEQARLSALMESIEIWQAERLQIPECWQRPEQLAAQSNIANLSGLPKAHRFCQLPTDYIPWVQGYEVISGKPCYLPFEAVSLDLSLNIAGMGYFARNSHGLSGGNNQTEAEVFALLELLERDSIARWELHSQQDLSQLTALDPQKAATPDLQKCWQQVSGQVCTGLWLIHQDPLPVVVCMMVDLDDSSLDPVGIYAGYSAHPNLEVAMLKALLESAQARCAIIAGAREDLDNAEFSRCRDPQQMQALRSLINHQQAVSPATLYSPMQQLSVSALRHRLAEIARQRGASQVLAYHFSEPKFDIHVVKAFCPGLHIPGLFERI